MAIYKKRWFDNIHLEFYLSIPFLDIQTRLLKQAVERLTYDICRVRIKLYKWSWEFQLYKRLDTFGELEPNLRLSQRLMSALKRPLRRGER